MNHSYKLNLTAVDASVLMNHSVRYALLENVNTIITQLNLLLLMINVIALFFTTEAKKQFKGGDSAAKCCKCCRQLII